MTFSKRNIIETILLIVLLLTMLIFAGDYPVITPVVCTIIVAYVSITFFIFRNKIAKAELIRLG